MTTSKLGRNLRAGDLIWLEDHTTYPTVWFIAEVTNVTETRRAYFSARRQWRITYRLVWRSAARVWTWHDATCYSDDRYELARRQDLNAPGVPFRHIETKGAQL